MTDERDRAAILARRRRFVAVALAGIAVQGGCDPKPRVCLKQAPPPTVDMTADAPDAGFVDEDEDAGVEPDASAPEPEPTVCLSPPIEPQVCLKIKQPPPPPPPPRPKPSVCLNYQ